MVTQVGQMLLEVCVPNKAAESPAPWKRVMRSEGMGGLPLELTGRSRNEAYHVSSEGSGARGKRFYERGGKLIMRTARGISRPGRRLKTHTSDTLRSLPCINEHLI